jgi:hypothetical protein
LNLYGIAAGDPVNFSDPFGLSPCILAPQICMGVAGGLVLGGVQLASNLIHGRPALEAVGSHIPVGAAAGLTFGSSLLAGAGGAVGTASTSQATFQMLLGDGQAVLAVVRGGSLIAKTSDISLSHREFVQRTLGALPDGARVVTIGKHGSEIVALNSRTFHGNQLPAPQEVLDVVRTLFK